jgi:muramidase (phage lysozyme)
MTAANLPREARALLDAIAQGESDPVAEKEGISPYFILVGGGSFAGMPNRDGYNGFPEWDGRRFPTGISHAAGRYQFEPATWKGIVRRFTAGQPNFRNADDQDWGAWFLAKQDYGARTGTTLISDLKQGNLDSIGSTLNPTWTSMSDDTFADRYNAALEAYPLEPAAPVPTAQPAEPAPAALVTPPAPPEVVVTRGSTQGFHTKVTASALAGAVTLIIITECARQGIVINGSEGASITLVIMAAIGWLAPSLPSD